MREIKFRAWDKKLKIMRIVEMLRCSKTGKILGVKVWENTGERPFEFIDTYQSEKDRFVIMQYTGLKDKNGKEIYEGDILKIGWAGSFYIGVVEYDAKSACYMFKSNDKFVSLNTFTLSPAAWIEVIGNIYENPELLEENNV